MPRPTSFDSECSPRAHFVVHAHTAQALADAARPRTCCDAHPFSPLHLTWI
uniref:Uncharacterized protein n=1 Tax=Solanum lycopersicum TaxID=4081 RepID=A0A494G8E4_SOLLC